MKPVTVCKMAGNFSSPASKNLVDQASLNDANKSDLSDKQTLLAVLQFLRKHNFKETEGLLKKESGITDDDVKTDIAHPSASEVSRALAAYKSDDDPTLYDDHYTDLKAFIESCLDVHKVELSMILYPVFVHMYLELVFNQHEIHAKEFYEKFCVDQEDYYQEDLRKLSTVTKKEHMQENQLMDNFKSSKFVIKMSRDSYTHLKRHLQEKQLNLLLNIIQEHLFIDEYVTRTLMSSTVEDMMCVHTSSHQSTLGNNSPQHNNKLINFLVFDGVPRTKQQIDSSAGGLLGEATREANKAKVFYGLLKEPDLNIPVEEEEETVEGEDRPKKKKPKKDPLLMKKSKNDPNAPANNRMPLPELKDQDKLEKITAFRETLKRVKLGPENLPSICFYTLLNSWQGVTSLETSEDSSLMSAGFADSTIRVWSLTPNKMRTMKSQEDLELIDKDADDVLERMMDDRTASDSKLLIGHNGPVYAASFTPDRNYLISSSEDGTIRLWSLQTWSNLVCYKGHIYPVWDVKFSAHGHYFASAGHDRTARLWSTDHYQPLRIFAGHLADVDCVQFHPNSNYVATGSSDRHIRLWDIFTGNCVRVMSGHKGAVHSLCFSPDGRYLASSGVDGKVILWDLSKGTMMSQMRGHTGTVCTLCFSRDGGVLASGGLDNCVKLWDVNRILNEQDTDIDVTIPSTLVVNENPKLLFGSYPTKSTPVLNLHFTRKNLLLAAGAMKTS